MPFRLLQECLAEVFTLGIPTWYTIILSAMWDTLFHCSANGITETLDMHDPYQVNQVAVKFVCKSNIVALLGLEEVSSLYCSDSQPLCHNPFVCCEIIKVCCQILDIFCVKSILIINL